MNEDQINDLAAYLEGDHSPQEREILLGRLSSDQESTDVLSLCSLPELQVENNLPVPFETPAVFLGGIHQGFILPAALKGLGYGKETSRLMGRLARIFGEQPPRLIREGLELEFPFAEKTGSLRLTVEPSQSDDEIHLSIGQVGSDEENIEFWEKGTLTRRVPCSLLSEIPPFKITPGVAVSIRDSNSPNQGAKVLLSSTEFSINDWKAAFASACVAGDLPEAVGILRNQLVPSIGRPEWLEKIRTQVSALSAVTKAEGPVLIPVPATRSSRIEDEVRSAVCEPVWGGILHCWTGAASLPNPWSEAFTADLQPPIESVLGQEEEDLARACIRASTGGSAVGAGDLKSGVPDTQVQNGRAALDGWFELASRDYAKALKSFRSTDPAPGDPFGLNASAVLAEHLQLCEQGGAAEEELEDSTDRVWDEILSPLF